MPHYDARRYERQICLPQIGEQGQNKLSKTSVLIVGAGGLGSISSLYLAAAGIGNITIIDNDDVEITNLNRQILHNEASIGKPKTFSAAQRIKELNSSIKVYPIQKRLDSDNIRSLIKGINIIIDATDNYKTRQIINRISIENKLPWVFGGVQGFEGMVTSFIPGLTPCFECIIPRPERSAHTPGIIGPTAGIIASIQAMEAIKLILNIGKSLKNTLLKISGLDMRIQTLTLSKNPDCPACSQIKNNRQVNNI